MCVRWKFLNPSCGFSPGQKKRKLIVIFAVTFNDCMFVSLVINLSAGDRWNDTAWVIKTRTKLLPISSPNVDGFSNSFNCYTQQESCNKMIIQIPPHFKGVATLPCVVHRTVYYRGVANVINILLLAVPSSRSTSTPSAFEVNHS